MSQKYTTVVILILISCEISIPAIFSTDTAGKGYGPQRGNALKVGVGETYVTINEALSAANDGDMIEVTAGFYNETIVIDKSIHLKGAGQGRSVIIDKFHREIISVITDNVTIEGFTFEGNSSTFYQIGILHAGWNISNKGGLEISNCSFSNIECATYINCSSNNILKDIDSDRGGIGFWWSSNNYIGRINYLNSYSHSCYLSLNTHCDYNIIEYFNSFHHSMDVDGDHNIIRFCAPSNPDGFGMRIFGHHNMVQNNLIRNNLNTGIIIFFSKYLELTNNTISGTKGGYGIHIMGGENCTIKFNNITNNSGYGIVVEVAHHIGDRAYHKVLYNNIIGNGGFGSQGYCSSPYDSWNTTFGGNYWSDGDNADPDRDGYSNSNYSLDGPFCLDGKPAYYYNWDKKPFANPIGLPFVPIITTVDETEAYKHELYRVEYKAVDLDTPQKDLTWSFSSNASWLTFTSDKVLTGTPAIRSVSYWVNISVSDGRFTDFTNYTLKIVTKIRSPDITTTDDRFCYEDEKYDVQYKADGDSPMSWCMRTNAPFLDFGVDNQTLWGIPRNEHVGKFWVEIEVSNSEFVDMTNFTLTVFNVNDPPEILTQNQNISQVGKHYYVIYKAFDDDPTDDVLTWSLWTDCDFLSIDRYTGVLEGIPDRSDIGIWKVEVMVSDQRAGFDNTSFKLNIRSDNDPPYALRTHFTIWIDEDTIDTSLNVNDIFKDPDDDTLSYDREESTHIFCSIKENGTIFIQPEKDWNGEESIKVSTTDGEFVINITIDVHVSSINDLPVIIEIKFHENLMESGNTQYFTAVAVDTDIGDDLIYQWMIDGMGEVGWGQNITLHLSKGVYILILRVYDRSGEYSEMNISITVEGMAPDHNGTAEHGPLTTLIVIAFLIPLLILIMIFILIFKKRTTSSPDKIEEISFVRRKVPADVEEMGRGIRTMIDSDRGKDFNKGNAPFFYHQDIVHLENENVDGLILIDIMEEVIENGGSGLTREGLEYKLESKRSDGSIRRKDYLRLKRLLNQLEE